MVLKAYYDPRDHQGNVNIYADLGGLRTTNQLYRPPLTILRNIQVDRPAFEPTGINHPQVSVGSGNVSVLQQGRWVSQQPPPETRIRKVVVDPQIDRRDQAHVEEKAEFMWVVEESGRYTLVINGRRYTGLTPSGAVTLAREKGVSPPPAITPKEPAPIVGPQRPQEPIRVNTQQTTGNGSMDLGNLLNTALQGVVDYNIAKVSAPTTQYVSTGTTPAYSAFDLAGDAYDYFVDGTGNPVAVPKKKKCRRRRKRLATKSDLGDLAALKAILGNGEAFKAWIATHSR